MARKRLEEILGAVEKEVAKAERAAENTKQSADEIARTAAHSPSQSGDSVHSSGQAHITQEYLARVVSFKHRLVGAQSETPGTIEAPCFVDLKFADGRETALYLVHDPVTITGFTLVSASSPLGLALIGKKVGSKFAYSVNGTKQTGEIVNVS
jgi:transcription elongation GreA/GreB family factor